MRPILLSTTASCDWLDGVTRLKRRAARCDLNAPWLPTTSGLGTYNGGLCDRIGSYRTGSPSKGSRKSSRFDGVIDCELLCGISS